MDETSRGLTGFLARRIRDFTHLAIAIRFLRLYFTKARRVRRRYREAERRGGTIWLDDGPFEEPPR